MRQRGRCQCTRWRTGARPAARGSAAARRVTTRSAQNAQRARAAARTRHGRAAAEVAGVDALARARWRPAAACPAPSSAHAAPGRTRRGTRSWRSSRRSAFGVARRRSAAPRDVLGPQVELHRVAGRDAVGARERERRAADAQRPPPRAHRRQHVDLADEVGDEGRRRRRGRPRCGVPTCSIAPWFITTMRSAIDSASSWSCVTMIVVTPSRCCSARISPRRRTRSSASSADSGSSSSSSAGRRGQRARQRDALLLAARELRRVLGAAVGQADQLQQLGDARARSRACGPARLTRP